jgi:plasmid stabilization system protein ParE
MKRDIFLTRQAEADQESILTWLGNRSSSGARSWFSALEAAMEWLEDHASSCPLAPENDWFEEQIREKLFKTKRGRPYRLLFVIYQDEVRIVHIRGPGQDLVGPQRNSPA